jgi:hypothetical protein
MPKSRSAKKRTKKKLYERRVWHIVYLNLQTFLSRREKCILSRISPAMNETIGKYGYFEFKVIDNIVDSHFLNLFDLINLISISKEVYFYKKNTLMEIRDNLFCEKCPLCQQTLTYKMKRKWTNKIKKFFKRECGKLTNSPCCDSEYIYQYYSIHPRYHYTRDEYNNLQLIWRKPQRCELRIKKRLLTNVSNPITKNLFTYYSDLYYENMIENNKQSIKFLVDRRKNRPF